MATVDFPASPNTGDTYAYNGVTYTYDGVKWTAAGAGAAALWKRTGTVLSPATAGDDVQIASLNSGPLAGFRNILINGNLTVNQRGVDVATAATGSYGQDRWKKTAGGMTQIVEEGNFEPGATYTLSGTGITTQQLTAPASGNWTIPDVPVTARKIQLEPGPVATPFEHRPIGLELSLCQRYCQKWQLGPRDTRFIANRDAISNLFLGVCELKVPMRIFPHTATFHDDANWHVYNGGVYPADSKSLHASAGHDTLVDVNRVGIVITSTALATALGGNWETVWIRSNSNTAMPSVLFDAEL